MRNGLSDGIREKRFKETKIGLLGGTVVYGKQEVDEYLQSLADDVEQMEKERKVFERKLELLESHKHVTSELKGRSLEELQQYEKDLVEQAKQVERMEKSFKRMVLMAEEEAEKIKADAEKIAQGRESESKKEAEKLLAEAKKLLDESQKEAETIILEAKERGKMIDSRTQEVKKDLLGIHSFIEKAIISEKGLDKSFFSEKAKQAVINE